MPNGTSRSANLNAQRFNTWLEYTLKAFRIKRIEDVGIAVGSRMVSKHKNHYSTLTEIREGTLVLDNKLEVTVDDVVVPVNLSDLGKIQP